MPLQLVVLIFIVFAVYYFRANLQTNDDLSQSLWVPLAWIFFASSLFPTQWLNIGTTAASIDIAEGSTGDAVVFFILILAGVKILMRRQINLSEMFKQNIWVWLFFCYGAVSILWSDYPFISFKRLIKAFGNVIMVAVILSEERPFKAFGVILTCVAFVFLPLSIIFIKYYPALGRAYHMGMPMFTGITSHKNGLGQTCLIFGIYFSWSLLFNRWNRIEIKQLHYLTYFVILFMIAWLLYKADSATSTICLAFSICLFLVGRYSTIARQSSRILYLTIGCIILFGLLEFLFDISATLITMMGRRPDLTTRIPMWGELIAMVKNPVVGFGYESFWLGARRAFMAERWAITSQAHNGYLEMYLNMGLIGLFFLLSWVLSGLRKINHYFSIDYTVALLRFCFVLVILIYNWTEATFYGVSIMWMILLLGVMKVPIQNSPGKFSDKLPIKEFKKPRPRSRSDSFLVETKNSSSVRKQPRLQYKTCAKEGDNLT